ncbi:hypothetical protein Barb7_03128 [Bacteroidales bacterium Barb7]|nr:hypothetical protein Barb7_03128 [Bacteroidales bacterium Barb7]
MLNDPLIAELIDLVHQAVEKFAVVRNDYNRPVKLFQGIFQYIFGAHVQMVGRLVENQEIDRLQQQADHSQTAALPAR